MLSLCTALIAFFDINIFWSINIEELLQMQYREGASNFPKEKGRKKLEGSQKSVMSDVWPGAFFSFMAIAVFPSRH